jgi:hypothetical protein
MCCFNCGRIQDEILDHIDLQMVSLHLVGLPRTLRRIHRKSTR